MIPLNNLQDIEAFEAQGIPQLPPNGYVALHNAAHQFPHEPALHFFASGSDFFAPQSWTYSQFLQEVNATANLFHAHGLEQGETVSYMLPNLPATYFTFFAAQSRGIVNPVNPMLEKEHIIDILNAGQCKLLVTLGPGDPSGLWERIEQVIPEVPTLKTVFTISKGHSSSVPSSPTNRVQVLDFLMEQGKHTRAYLDFDVEASANSISSYFHTGGTTGRPKLAQRTQLNEISNARICIEHLGLRGRKVFLCGLPWFHANAALVTGMMPLYHGHQVVLATENGYRDKQVMQDFWKIVEHYKVNLFSAVPTILKRLLTIPIDNANLDSLDSVICGAAPLSTKLFNEFQDSTGIKILEGYGFTEGTCVNTLNPVAGKRKIGSIGLPLAFHRMKVVIMDDEGHYHRDAAVNEIGLFVAQGINIFPGYKEEEHNQYAWVDDGKSLWYNTGDIGRQDEDGYFWITGRKKELIIRGGHNIDPKSIEEPLCTHPAVAAAAAVSRPDDHAGELPVAYVELKPGASVSLDELEQHAKDNIPERAAIPKKIYIIDQLPLTAVGKVFKPNLVNRQIKEVFTEVVGALEGVQSFEVTHVKDQLLGRLTLVYLEASDQDKTKEVMEAANKALSLYPVKFEIKEKA